MGTAHQGGGHRRVTASVSIVAPRFGGAAFSGEISCRGALLRRRQRRYGSCVALAFSAQAAITSTASPESACSDGIERSPMERPHSSCPRISRGFFNGAAFSLSNIPWVIIQKAPLAASSDPPFFQLRLLGPKKHQREHGL